MAVQVPSYTPYCILTFPLDPVFISRPAWFKTCNTVTRSTGLQMHVSQCVCTDTNTHTHTHTANTTLLSHIAPSHNKHENQYAYQHEENMLESSRPLKTGRLAKPHTQRVKGGKQATSMLGPRCGHGQWQRCCRTHLGMARAGPGGRVGNHPGEPG